MNEEWSQGGQEEKKRQEGGAWKGTKERRRAGRDNEGQKIRRMAGRQ